MSDISAVITTNGDTYNLKDATARESLVPSGGTTGQVLTKTASGYGWADASGGGGVTWGSITGTLSDQTDLEDELIGLGYQIISVGDSVNLVRQSVGGVRTALNGTTETISTSGWSSTTTTVDGIPYYTYATVLRSGVVSGAFVMNNPIISLVPSTGNTLPTAAEREAYGLWDFATYESFTLTLYARRVPTSDFNLRILGA